MKNYWLGVIALALTVGVLAFTAPKYRANQYAVYRGAGPENLRSSYIIQASRPPNCPGSLKVCWFWVIDTNIDGIISNAEFQDSFNAVDADHDGLLSDQTEQPGILEKQFFTLNYQTPFL